MALGVEPSRTGDRIADSLDAAIVEAAIPPARGTDDSMKPRVMALYVRGTAAQLVLGESANTHWLIEAAGGVDVSSEVGVLDNAPISAEAILAAAPDVLLERRDRRRTQRTKRPGGELMASPEFELLRLGVALAHVVPEAEMRISAPAGSNLSVSSSPSADMDICDLRQLAVSSSCPRQPDISQWIEIIEIGGSLEYCAEGVYRVRHATDDQRWFATLLSPREVIDVLMRLESRAEVDESLKALLKPDLALGVTSVRLRAGDPAADVDIDEAAQTMHGACLVSELLRCSGAPRGLPAS